MTYSIYSCLLILVVGFHLIDAHGYTEPDQRYRRSGKRCSASHDRTKREDHAQFPRHLHHSDPVDELDFASYFSGASDIIRLTNTESVPRASFTVAFWLKPEGGQFSQTDILRLHDTCELRRENGWAIGINTKGSQRQDAHLFFQLKTDRSKSPTQTAAPFRYEVHRWYHIAASYDEWTIKLYINGAKVGAKEGQRGPLFSEVKRQCKELEFGGSSEFDVGFRGSVDEMHLWSKVLSHRQIALLYNNQSNSYQDDAIVDRLVFWDPFDNFTSWTIKNDRFPRLIPSDISSKMHDMSLTTPKCGITVCDNPVVVGSYIEQASLRRPKIVRYRVINIAMDDGTYPMVSRVQIERQHNELNRAFGRYNITFKRTDYLISNTSLRQTQIIPGCEADDIGNSKCDVHCSPQFTGNDGGDCDDNDLHCSLASIGNGKCDDNCNRAYHDWDGGDCCDPQLTDTFETCFDPSSRYCMFMGEREYKTTVGLDSREYLNIYIAKYTDEELLGTATMPWDFGVYGLHGGIVMHADAYGVPGVMDSVIHEIGHSLGLWHVFHGVTEMRCSEECFETEPSLELGDLIADTNPTPMNDHCRDPRIDEISDCGLSGFRDTPFRNYMSYANDSCTQSFTHQQMARMHCYLDLFYQPWQKDREPSVIPLPPKVISKSADSVTIAWQPPLTGHNVAEDSKLCHDCVEGDVLIQYAESAFSPHSENLYGDYSPQQATGPPNAAKCSVNHRTWWIEKNTCENCKLKLNFKFPVVPAKVVVWVTKLDREQAIHNIELVTVNKTRISLGSMDVYCDIPLSTKLDNIVEKVKSVIIYTNGPFVAIDAVQLISRPGHNNCQTCKPISYYLTRDPPFVNSKKGKLVNSTVFEDDTVDEFTEYTYRVQATSKHKTGDPSPPLVIGTGFRFCGNGKIESGETCDDGNVLNNDGCNVNCKEETGFKCAGAPSLCYRYDGDGECEEFEKQTNVADCGFYTPPRFYDQWASYARGNPKNQGEECPESNIIGEPPRDQVCSYRLTDALWSPCGAGLNDYNLWLKVGFPKAVVVTSVLLYIGADGITTQASTPTHASVKLIDTDGVNHYLDQNVPLKCSSNPAAFNVKHDLSEPFYYSREVIIELDYKFVGISGVRLRSLKSFDPLILQSCGEDELYSPATRQCNRYSCEIPTCTVPEARYATISRNVGDVVEEGETYTIECDKGHRPLGKHEVMCVNGQWEGNDVTCKPVDCGNPDITYATTLCPEGTLFGRTCNFKCNPPAKMQGTDKTVTCLEDGEYSLPNSFCQQHCDPPPIPLNSLPVTSQPLTYNVGSNVRYRCKVGYHVQNKRHRRTFRLQCGENLEWSGPSCVRVQCPLPPAMYQGLYNCSDDRYFQSQCRLQCPDRPEKTIVTCGQRGWDTRWDDAFAACMKHTSSHVCPEPQSSSEVEFRCNGNLKVGTNCTAACNAYGHDAVLANTSLTDNAWNTKGRHIVCTVRREWYPDPSLVTCVKGCQEDFIRDGYCDGINNRAYCNWDGGDCCTSTVTDGEVIPFPAGCTKDCRCLDPNAIENQQK